MSGVDFTGGVIEEDVRCTHCGYSLKGLVRGGRCPECGTVSRISKSATYGHVPMVEVSKRYLRVLAAGLSLMAVGGVALVAAVAMMLPFVPSTQGVFLGCLALAVLAWPVGIVLALQPRPVRQNDGAGLFGREWMKLRIATGVTQIGGAAALITFEVLSASTGVGLFGGLAFASLAVMVLGWVPTCLYLAEIAWWGDDNRTQEWLHTAAWCIGGGTVVASASWGLIQATEWLLLVIIGGLFAMLWAFGVFVMAMCIVSLSSTARWAIKNQESVRAREARVAEKVRREEEERMARLADPVRATPEQEALADEVLSQDEPVEGPAPRSGAGAHHHARQGLVIDRSDDGDIYRLEDDEDAGERG